LHNDSPGEETESEPSVWDDCFGEVTCSTGPRLARRERGYREDSLRNFGAKVDNSEFSEHIHITNYPLEVYPKSLSESDPIVWEEGDEEETDPYYDTNSVYDIDPVYDTEYEGETVEEIVENQISSTKFVL